MAVVAKALHVVGTVLDIDVRPHLVLVLHEAKIPIGDAVMIEPCDGLRDGDGVEIGNEQPVGDDANAVSFIRELPERLASARNHRDFAEQLSFHDGEAVQAVVLIRIFNAPF